MPEVNKLQSQPRRPVWITSPRIGTLTVAGWLLLLGLLIWTLVQNQQLREQLRQERAQRTALEQKSSEQLAHVESPQRTSTEEQSLRQTLAAAADGLTKAEDGKQPSLASFILHGFLSGLSRGGDDVTPQKLIVPAKTTVLRLQFPTQSDRFRQYHVSLLRIEGASMKVLQKFSGLTAGKTQQLKLQVPAALLKPGNYTLKLTGVGANNQTESVGEYRFDVRSHR